MEENLILESIKFMVLGMGVVFSFLIIMVYALKVQAVLINKFFPLDEKQSTKKIHPQTDASDSAKKVAAISVAIQHHNTKG